MIGSVTRTAAMAGVGVYSVASCDANPPRRTGIVLGSVPLHEREMREDMRRLAVALSSKLKTRLRFLGMPLSRTRLCRGDLRTAVMVLAKEKKLAPYMGLSDFVFSNLIQAEW